MIRAGRETEDLYVAAARVTCAVTQLCGADDPRPWTATGSLLEARPDTRRVIIDAVRRKSGPSRH